MRSLNTFPAVRFLPFVLVLLLASGCDTLGIGGDDDTSDTPTSTSETRLYPILLDGRWGYVDDRGRMAIQPQLAEARGFANGLAPVRTRTSFRWGYVDATGQIAIEDRFQETRTFRSGRGAVRLDNRWGFVDASGDLVISPRFYEIDSFSEGYAFVRFIDFSWGYIDADGRPMERGSDAPGLQDHDWTDVSDGVALIRTNNEFRYLLMDRTGATGSALFDTPFVDARPFHEGVAPVKVSDRWGLIDKTGTFVVSPRFIAMEAFGEGLAPARVGGDAWGYVAKDGSVAIAPKWDEARSFAGGRAAVRSGVRWGFIDTSGREIVSPQFDEVRDYENGAAAVLRFVGDDTFIGYVDEDGAYLWYPTD